MRILVPLLATAALAAQTHPDFSGVWQMDKEKSQVDSSVGSTWMKIQHSESSLVVNVRVQERGGEENQTMRYSLGPEESSNTMHGAPMKSRVAWEGSTLVVTSVAMFGDKALRMTDRWHLSDDGKILHFEERHQFGTEPEGESRFVMERRNPDEWPAEEKPKPAEEVYKNIQVMKGMPATRLPVVMGFFTKWLGVDCAHCHVPPEFEKDDKEAKRTARKMLGMVHKINEENFGGPGPVTCWTCHRGSAKPESMPPK